MREAARRAAARSQASLSFATMTLRRWARRLRRDAGEPRILYLDDSERGFDRGRWAQARSGASDRGWLNLPLLSSHMLLFGTTRSGKSSFWDAAALQWARKANWERRSSFNERVSIAIDQKAWELSADEAVDERHPMLIQAFANACDHWERAIQADPEREEALDELALQIARRLLGLRSEAPEASWFEGIMESDSRWPSVRDRARARIEALDIEAQIDAASVATRRPRRSL